MALLPVRDGELPLGSQEASAEAGGRALVVGSGALDAAESLTDLLSEARVVELGSFSPGAWARQLAPLLDSEEVVILPGSPDGRDLAPRLAAQMARPFFASAISVDVGTVTTIRNGGRVLATSTLSGPSVVTIQPGVRNVVASSVPPAEPVHVEIEPVENLIDAVIDEVLPPDISTMDLSEAPRILGGGAGLDDADRFDQLARVAVALDASMGATRVITDRGWLGHDRQIGTTGVVVDPRLYIAFGISGAVQHTAGLGNPEHVVSVNVDEHAPMMELADLAIVADANATLDELERLLGSAGSVEKFDRPDQEAEGS